MPSVLFVPLTCKSNVSSQLFLPFFGHPGLKLSETRSSINTFFVFCHSNGKVAETSRVNCGRIWLVIRTLWGGAGVCHCPGKGFCQHCSVLKMCNKKEGWWMAQTWQYTANYGQIRFRKPVCYFSYQRIVRLDLKKKTLKFFFFPNKDWTWGLKLVGQMLYCWAKSPNPNSVNN